MTSITDSLTTLRAIRSAVDAAIVAMDAAVLALMQLTPRGDAAATRSAAAPVRAKVIVKKRSAAQKAAPVTASTPSAPAKTAPADGSVATRILRLLAERGGSLKGREIAAYLDLDEQATKRALRQLRDAGQLALSGATSSARWSPSGPAGVTS